MTDDLRELGRRAVACEGWRWMPGMLPIGDRRICSVITETSEGAMPQDVGTWVYTQTGAERYSKWCGKGRLPDFSDPATLGCLEALVTEGWGVPVFVVLSVKGWALKAPWTSYDGRPYVGSLYVGSDDAEVLDGHYPSKAAALVAALEAVPGRWIQTDEGPKPQEVQRG